MLELEDYKKEQIKKAEQNNLYMENAKTIIKIFVNNLLYTNSVLVDVIEQDKDEEEKNFLDYVRIFLLYYTRQLIFNPKQLDNATAERVLKDLFIESEKEIIEESKKRAEEHKTKNNKA